MSYCGFNDCAVTDAVLHARIIWLAGFVVGWLVFAWGVFGFITWRNYVRVKRLAATSAIASAPVSDQSTAARSGTASDGLATNHSVTEEGDVGDG